MEKVLGLNGDNIDDDLRKKWELFSGDDVH